MAESAEAEAEEREVWRATAIAWALVLIVVVGISAAMAHSNCFEPGPPVDRPMSGTPRAGYCAALQATDPWLSLTVLPLLAYAVAVFALRGRRPFWLGLVAAAIGAAIGVLAWYGGTLEFATTF